MNGMTNFFFANRGEESGSESSMSWSAGASGASERSHAVSEEVSRSSTCPTSSHRRRRSEVVKEEGSTVPLKS
jgi:hypothetical protein